MKIKTKQNIYRTVLLMFLTGIITFIITVYGLYTYLGSSLIKNNNSNENSSILQSVTSSSKLDTYLKNLKAVVNKYYLWNDKIDEEKMESEAIKGYIAGLGDEYTEYIPASEMKEYTESVTGTFVGIGIYMIKDESKNRVIVYYPIEDSPAEKAGIKSGDIIISVDGVEYTGDNFEDISNYIKGKEGTTVKLTIERDGEQLDFEVKREKINTASINSKLLDDEIGYIRIPSFDSDFSTKFKNKIEELKNQGVQNLIIDIRNNGGGILDEATKIADYFLEKDKKIISTVDRDGKKEEIYSKQEPIFDGKVIVLVNKYTASASEVLASALQDNERAKIVGTTTYGKGVIQSVLSLRDGSGLKITTNEYYTPNEKQIHKIGVTPNEIIEISADAKNKTVITDEDDTQLQKAIELLR